MTYAAIAIIVSVAVIVWWAWVPKAPLIEGCGGKMWDHDTPGRCAKGCICGRGTQQ